MSDKIKTQLPPNTVRYWAQTAATATPTATSPTAQPHTLHGSPAPSHLPQLGKAEKCGRSRPRPPQSQPNGGLAGASQRVEAGFSRRHDRACANGAGALRPQNGGGGINSSRAARAKFPFPSSSQLYRSWGHCGRPPKGPAASPAKSGRSRPTTLRVREMKTSRPAGRGAQPLCKNDPNSDLPSTSVPLKQYAKRETCPSAHLESTALIRRRPPQREQPQPLTN
ncbi:uncharacterized protein LOC112628401 [Theropithecus gelada]|uniref:uncharacterized protein LOC112628401 n=1 Tax=Theropithecus gelada TaxID=9565 RepID=UPI000DC192B7|nr:uncharacterized protein LOC112628401 [Theropithecus gelada]